ncbi:hypothetical protein [Reinekea sp.]|jgi:hypothetical protein|uniref:hypothetical protein n=1 Tax=Reinekea sp. TaxID=1970455 RepID=UPI00398A2544
MEAEQVEFGDIDQLESMQAEAANDEQASNADNGPPPSEWPYDPVIAENAAMITAIGFNMASKKFGDHWNLRRDDRERLGVALAQCADHYIKWFERLGPAGNLALVTAMMVGPRMIKTGMMNASNKAKEKNSVVATKAANDE